MKKMLAMLLTAAMTLGMLAGCGSKDSGEGGDASSESDKAYVQDKGTLVIGITDFAPMDYKDENGDWIGFDADMAKAFAESLGVEAEFVQALGDGRALVVRLHDVAAARADDHRAARAVAGQKIGRQARRRLVKALVEQRGALPKGYPFHARSPPLCSSLYR